MPFVVLLLLAAKAWQHYTLRQPTEEPPGSAPELKPYQMGALGQRQRAVMAAVAALVHARVQSWEDGVLKVVGEPPENAGSFERAVHAALATPVQEISELYARMKRELDDVEEELRNRGLRMEHEVAARCMKYPAMLYCGVALGPGLLTLGVGLHRDRPVEFLEEDIRRGA